MTLKNDSSPEYLAVPADCLKLHSSLAPLVKNYGSMDIAVSCGAKVRAQCHAFTAQDCERLPTNEDNTVAKQSSLFNIFLIDLLGKYLKS